ncbi:MAG: D-aminoacyl-tRNA deacylase [Bacteroidia bacterium]|nr:D-aminoacyl-tRNA deacylase [Bacteroidia bacterium]MDW8134965.1 D-aminoacyl-tRNA deacylase [Bacteroidia bacterium]
MRLLIQRVSSAEVKVGERITGKIERGLLVLVGFHHADNEALLHKAAHKVLHLRIFEDNEGRMNRSLLDVGGSLLVVSQFTLYGRLEKGFRPSFIEAAPAEKARQLYEAFLAELRSQASHLHIATGEFGAFMHVYLCNYGPVTIILEF